MKQQNIIASAVAAVPLVRKFAPPSQMREIIAGTQGDEREKFLGILADFGDRIFRMPAASGDKAPPLDAEGEIAQLHYRVGRYNWYLTRKGSENPVENAVVFVTAPGVRESIGFISVQEILASGGELDLSFKPQRLSKIPRIGGKKPARKPKASPSNA